MTKASSVILVLASVAIIAYLALRSDGADEQSEAESAVQVPVFLPLPQRTSQPIAQGSDVSDRRMSTPDDRASLTRELQSELKRVGCYDGRINGVWTASTRKAMKAFTDRVNAMLPIDEPDQILLALVKAHQHQTCGTGCPAGVAPAEDDRCRLNAIAADAMKDSGLQTSDITESEEKAQRAVTGFSQTANAGSEQPTAPVEDSTAPIAPKAEQVPGAPKSSAQLTEAALQPQVSARPAAPANVSERRPRRTGRKGTTQSSAFTRSVAKGIKNVQRAFASVFQ